MFVSLPLLWFIGARHSASWAEQGSVPHVCRITISDPGQLDRERFRSIALANSVEDQHFSSKQRRPVWHLFGPGTCRSPESVVGFCGGACRVSDQSPDHFSIGKLELCIGRRCLGGLG